MSQHVGDPPFDSSALSSAENNALIARLLAQIDGLRKRLAAVEVENAALRAKLNPPTSREFARQHRESGRRL
jgi:hypothetical protein